MNDFFELTRTTGFSSPAVVDPLVHLASEINRLYDTVVHHATEAVGASIALGQNLIEAKETVPHGEWEGWLRDNTKVHPTTARRRMRLALEDAKSASQKFIEELLTPPEVITSACSKSAQTEQARQVQGEVIPPKPERKAKTPAAVKALPKGEPAQKHVPTIVGTSSPEPQPERDEALDAETECVMNYIDELNKKGLCTALIRCISNLHRYEGFSIKRLRILTSNICTMCGKSLPEAADRHHR